MRRSVIAWSHGNSMFSFVFFFWEIPILFSIVAAPIYIPTNSVSYYKILSKACLIFIQLKILSNFVCDFSPLGSFSVVFSLAISHCLVHQLFSPVYLFIQQIFIDHLLWNARYCSRYLRDRVNKIYIPIHTDMYFIIGSVTQSCPTLCDRMDYTLPGSSVHGFLQARILEWVAISYSRGSFQPRDWTQVSCLAGRFFTIWATREAPYTEHVFY